MLNSRVILSVIAFLAAIMLVWLLVFAFCLGFGTTVAEPALIAISHEAARTMAEAKVIADSEALAAYIAAAVNETLSHISPGLTSPAIRPARTSSARASKLIG